MRSGAVSLSPLLVGLGLAGCVDPNDIREIKNNQKAIMEKLDEISKKGGPARPQQRRPQPGRPDPNKVYSFPAGDGAAKGPKDAWVTVIEVSDFQ